MLDKNKSYEEIFKSLPSFYEDYVVDDSLLKTVVVSYMHAMDMLVGWTNDTFRNNTIMTAETTRVLPYTSFDASGAMYTFTRIASMPRANFFLGVPSSYTQEELIEYWKYSASPSQKVALLKQMGIYVEFITGDYMSLALDGESKDRYKADVISEGTELYFQGHKMIEGLDYVIRDNKLFILDMLKFDINNPQVVMRNITLDYDMAWRRTGCYLGIKHEPFSDVVEKVEYNFLNKLFIKIASTGPILNEVNKALQEMFDSEGVSMYDAFSRNNEKDYFWKASATTPPAITEDGRSVTIGGDTVFQFENGVLIDDDTVTLEANTVGINNPTFIWRYADDGVYIDYENGNDNTFTLSVDDPSFISNPIYSTADDINCVEIQLECIDGITNKSYYAYTTVSKTDRLKYVGEAAYLKGRPLSQFDFVVALPRGYATPGIADKESKVDLLAKYLNVIKPTYSYFFLSWVEVIGEDGSEDIIPEDFKVENAAFDGEECVDFIEPNDELFLRHKKIAPDDGNYVSVTTNILDYNTTGLYIDTRVPLVADEEPYIRTHSNSQNYYLNNKILEKEENELVLDFITKNGITISPSDDEFSFIADDGTEFKSLLDVEAYFLSSLNERIGVFKDLDYATSELIFTANDRRITANPESILMIDEDNNLVAISEDVNVHFSNQNNASIPLSRNNNSLGFIDISFRTEDNQILTTKADSIEIVDDNNRSLSITDKNTSYFTDLINTRIYLALRERKAARLQTTREYSPCEYMFENVAMFLHTFPEAPTGFVVNYSEGTVKLGFNNSGVGATEYQIFRNGELIKKYPIISSNRADRIVIEDSDFTNIKTDKYSIRTYFKSDIEGEERTSHFIDASVSK